MRLAGPVLTGTALSSTTPGRYPPAAAIARSAGTHAGEQKSRVPFRRPRPSTFAPHLEQAGAAWRTAHPNEQKTDRRPR